MLEAAKAKQTYTDLYAADLVDVLENYKATMDLVIAMDVLCYFGDLTHIFQRCHDVLADKGIFSFSVVKPKTSALWELQVQGHFVHSLEHLQQVGEKTGFKQIFVKELPLRRELNEDQYGYVCLYQKI
jgi:predicted TPR repeat methyltransferase